MENYKEYIKKSISDGKTSLGPANYLSDEAKSNLYKDIVSNIVRSSELITNFDDNDVFKLITKVSKIEEKIKESAEKICSDWIIRLFDIPQDTISVEMNLVQSIDDSGVRKTPGEVKIPTNINHDKLIAHIMKRRLLLSICAGAASVLSSQLWKYKEFSKTSKRLVKLYDEISCLRDWSVFCPDKKYGLTGNMTTTVFITNGENKPEIRCDATCSPLLIEGTIKGLFELAISHGLPKNSELAGIIIEKSDFSLADKWDLMIGIPLFERIASVIGSFGIEFRDIGYNFFMMELSTMKPDKLFRLIDGILVENEESKKMLKAICEKITNEKDMDDFDDFVKSTNDKFPINDEYMTSDELWTESFQQ